MQAVILAGGLGTRLRPITYKIPKHMVKIAGKPFLERLIGMLKENGITDIVLCVGYLHENIMDYFGKGEKFGVEIKYSIENKNLLGTGGAIKHAAKYLKGNFFVIYGDSYLKLDYKKLMQSHQKFNKTGTMAVYNNKSRTFVKNNVEIGKDGHIANYNKESTDKKMKYVDAGVLAFKKSILKKIPSDKKISLEEDIFPKVIKSKELCSFKSSSRFYDIGSMQRLRAFKKVLS